MLIIKVIQTFISDNAYEPWKKAILAVPLHSRSAIKVHIRKLVTHLRTDNRRRCFFATSTWQNELLLIIDQQKVCFMIIFAA